MDDSTWSGCLGTLEERIGDMTDVDALLGGFGWVCRGWFEDESVDSISTDMSAPPYFLCARVHGVLCLVYDYCACLSVWTAYGRDGLGVCLFPKKRPRVLSVVHADVPGKGIFAAVGGLECTDTGTTSTAAPHIGETRRRGFAAVASRSKKGELCSRSDRPDASFALSRKNIGQVPPC